MTLPPKTATIIGAGIAGCATAYALARRGIQVTLLERNASIASEASGNPQAMLYPRISGDDDASRFALACYLYSLDFLKTFNLNPAELQICGMLQLGFNPRELARIQKVTTQNYAEAIVKYVSAHEASSLAGIALDHDALYFPNAAWLNPQSLCQRLTSHCNISIKTLTNVDNLLNNNGLFEMYANGNLIIKSDIVIIANANEAQNLGLNLYLKTHAVRGQVSVLAANEVSHKIKTIICSDGYLSPQNRGQHCLGATFSTENKQIELNEQDHLLNLNSLKNASSLLFESVKDNITGGRVSFRCSSDDYLPLVGQLLDNTRLIMQPPRPNAKPETLPWVSGLYINVGHGSRGFTSAPFCAEYLAQHICNEPISINKALAKRLNPNRFMLRKLGLKQLATLL